MFGLNFSVLTWITIGAFIAIAAAGGGGYLKGRMDCAAKAKVEMLEGTINELVRQREAAEIVASDERERAHQRAQQIRALKERLAEYERDEANAGTQSCTDAIGPSDRDRLLRLRR